jgi:hypothetical protein
MVKTVLATTITLAMTASIIQVANASSLPNRESIKYLEREGRKYAIINFSNKECKISGTASKQASLYSCFAIVYPGGIVSSITYMMTSKNEKIKDSIQCPLSGNKNQATLFHTRFSDNLPRKGLGAFATYAQARNVTKEGSLYYADIAFPAWWLNNNKHVYNGLVDVKAEDICGINYYFRPSAKFTNLVNTFK